MRYVMILTLLHLTSSLALSQTVTQLKLHDQRSYYRLTESVSINELDKKLFKIPNSALQVTYQDGTQQEIIKFVSDQTWHRIVFGDYQKWMKAIGSYGTSPGQFIMPTCLSFGSYYSPATGLFARDLFVVDNLKSVIQVFTIVFGFGGATSASYKTTISQATVGEPLSLIGDAEFFWLAGNPYLAVSEPNKHRILFYELTTGNYVFKTAFGTLGSGTNNLKHPKSISAEMIWTPVPPGSRPTTPFFIEDEGNGRIIKLTLSRNSDGTVAVSWGGTMAFNYDLTSLDTDDNGNVWISDATNHRLYKYTSSFSYLATFGSYGTGSSESSKGTLYYPKHFSMGILNKKQTVGYSMEKTRLGFAVEPWTNSTGGIIYSVGTEITAMSISGPSSLVGTQISYFVTDHSMSYLTIEKKSGSSWSVIRTFGQPIGSSSPYIASAGANYFTWDGKDNSGAQHGAGEYRMTLYVRDLYDDPDSETLTRQMTYSPPLSGSISGASNVNYGQNYTWNASGSGGTVPSYTYEWYKGSTYVGNNSYLTTSFTSNTTLYLKVRSGANQITVSKSITVGSGGGCPFVLAETPYGFEPDNNILHRSELNKGRDIEDIYSLRVKPQRNGQSYRLQVREYNEDYSYFDQFNLYYVDHAAEKQIGVTEENEIVLYDRSSIESPSAIELADGRPLDQAGNKNDVMNLRFSKASIDRLNSKLTGNGSRLALVFDLERPARLLPPGKGPGPSITVQGGDGLGKSASSQSYLSFDWRTGDYVALVPLDEGLNLEEFTIEWTREYAIKSMGLVSIEPVKEPKKLELTSAKHSRRGDVTDRIVSTDKKYAEVGKDDYIDLTFRDDSESNESLTRDFVFTTTGRYVVPGKGEAAIPTEFGLDQNYPNPFNPSTQIRYYLPQDERVTLKVYNLLGQEVRTLVSGFESAGIKTINWDGRNDQGHRVASGVYIYKLTAGNFTKARKLMLVK